jgi:hypothetical protein
MADTIRARIAEPPRWLDERLEPLDDRLRRLIGEPETVAAPMRRVSMDDVKDQIAQATALRDTLRQANSVTFPHAASLSIR